MPNNNTNDSSYYLSCDMKSRGYTGTTGGSDGRTPYQPATGGQVQALQDASNSSALRVPRTISSNATVINVNFDGTQNGDFPKEGETKTNINELSELQKLTNGVDNVIYKPGVGAQTDLSGTLDPITGRAIDGSSSSDWTSTPFQQTAGVAANAIVVDAYRLYAARVNVILADDPNADISLNVAGFSRGGAQAVAFANMVNELGVPPSKAPGSIRIASMTLLDPVDQTNGALNTKVPTNVDNTLVIVAGNENRGIMPAMRVGDEAVVLVVPGAHSNIGGTYNPQGVQAVVLKMMVDFMESSGAKVGAIPPELQADWGQMAIHNAGLKPSGAPALGGENGRGDIEDGSTRTFEGAKSGDPTVQQTTQQPPLARVNINDDGSGTYSLTYADGRTIERVMNNDRTVYESTYTKSTGSGTFCVTVDGKGVKKYDTLVSNDDDGNRLVTQTFPNGNSVVSLFDDKRQLMQSTLTEQTPDGSKVTVTQGVDSHTAGGVTPVTQTEKVDDGTDSEATSPVVSEGSASISQSTSGLVTTTQTTRGTINDSTGTASTNASQALQKIPLPSGGYLIANEDGEIVGSGTPVGANGVMRVEGANGDRHFETTKGVVMTDTQAAVFERTGVDLATPIADQYDKDIQGKLSGMNAGNALSNAFQNWGHLTDVQRASALLNAYNSAAQISSGANVIINEGGTQSPFTPPPSNLASQAGAALNLLMSAQQIGHWDQMSDMQRAQAISSLASSGNSLAQTFDSGSKDFGQSMGQFASGLSFADALAHGGDRAILTSGLQFANAFNGAADQVISNWVADASSDAAVNAAAGTAGSTVPYVGIAMAVLNFEQNPGAAIGAVMGNFICPGPIGSMLGSVIGGAIFGGASKPPPPEGEIHFEWNAQTGIHIVMDKDVGGAGAFAASFAGSVKNMVEGMVDGANEKSKAASLDPAQPQTELLALNPFKLPRMGVGMAGAWIEVMQGDGTVIREDIHNETFATRIVAILQDSGALTSQWEVDTVKAHYAEEVQTNPAEALAHARAGMGGHAGAGNQAFALQGNAVEAADFKTQSFGALVIHAKMDGVTSTLNQIKTINVIHNVDQDSYLEKSEWVSGTDESGQPQGVLVLDFNGDGQIETRDILNLGGNVGQDGNQTDEALQATSNGALQRNNANWLDANGDHILDARDPAFAAIKLLIDINNNGTADAGEMQSLTKAGIESINLATGEVQYLDGHTGAMTATSLTAQTSGDKQTQIQEVQADGTVTTLNAGDVIEHEGYTGQVQITDDGGALGSKARWVGQREQTYDHQALRTGDWEGTAQQDEHRHGGGNVLADGTAAPTETTASGTITLGKVKTAEQKPNAVQLVTGVTVTTGAALGFVPLAAFAGTTQSTIQQVTDDMIQSAGNTMFGGASGSSAGGASLGAVGAGMGSGQVNVVNGAGVQTNAVRTELALVQGFTNSAPSPQPSPTRGEGANAPAASPEPTVFVAAGINNFQSAPAVVSTAPSTPAAPTTATVASASTTPQPLPAVVQGVVAAPVRATVVSVTPAASSPAPAPAPTPTPIPAAPVLQAPTLQSETLAGAEDGVFRLSSSTLLANDTSANAADPSQPTLTITSVANPTNGQVGLSNGVNGIEVVFIPDTNFHGTATFSYTVTDQYGLSSTATATLQIAAVNDLPVATGETASSNEDTAIIFTQAQLLTNDSDVDTATDGQTLSISAVSGATNGVVTLLANGDISFTPNANYHGAAAFTYTVSDGNGGTADASVNLTVLAVNDAPVAAGEALNGAAEDTTLLIAASTLLANDTDVETATDGQVLSIQSVSGATHGTVSLVTLANGSQQINFVPDSNYNGAAQFSYTVTDGNGATSSAIATLNVTAVNDAPVTANETAQTDEDVGLVFTQAQLLQNDTDVDVATNGQVLSVSRVGQAQNGTAYIDAQNQVSFVPDANYHGAASFTYWVSDGNGGETPATVNVTVLAVNDAPVATGEALSGAVEDTTLVIAASTLLANDTDVDTATDGQVLSIQSVSNATHGTVSLVTLANGQQQINFVPDLNYNGQAAFSYTVTDGNGATSTAIATLTIAAVNDAPVVTGESVNTNEDTTLLFNPSQLLANDSDVDVATNGQVLTISAVSNAQHGAVSILANGQIQFVPDVNYNGVASFDYVVSDGAGGLRTATTTINLAAVNDAPVATGEMVNGTEDTALIITAAALLQNDSDVDNAQATLTLSRVQSGTGGTVTLNANGTVSFVPTANFNGAATFTYWVRDPAGLESNPVTTTIAIAAVNDAPSAQGEIVTGAIEDATFTIPKSSLLTNDSDVDNANSELSIGWVGSATGGTVSINASGNVVFTPTANFNGNATFQYRVRDANGLESPNVTAVIPVTAVNDAPVAVNDLFTTYKNSTMTMTYSQLTSNDTDVDGDALTVSGVRNASNGVVSIVSGQVQFVPTAGYTGAASFQYLTDDQHGGQVWATASVTVREPPNLYPTLGVTGVGIDWYNSAYHEIRSFTFSFSINDDGNRSAVSMNLNYANGSGGGYGWDLGAAGGATLSLSAGSGTISIYPNFVDGDGSWGRYTYLNAATTAWTLTDDRGLSNTMYFNIDYSAQNYSISYARTGYFYPPVVLDLNGNGVQFTSINDSKFHMDVSFDGIADKMAWAANDDGVLVWDKDANGTITDASEFGFQKLREGAATDLEGLQALDTNGNGRLDAGDQKFTEFAVWQDANGNGVTDAGEFKTLAQMGIDSINLQSNGQMRDETDVTIMGEASFTRSDGTVGVLADAMFAFQPGQALQSLEQAEINRMALLFNQVVNTAVDVPTQGLGCVPIEMGNLMIEDSNGLAENDMAWRHLA